MLLGELLNVFVVQKGVYGDDLNGIKTNGIYRIKEGSYNGPITETLNGSVVQHVEWDTNAAVQLIFVFYEKTSYFRFRTSGTWGIWKKIKTE